MTRAGLVGKTRTTLNIVAALGSASPVRYILRLSIPTLNCFKKTWIHLLKRRRLHLLGKHLCKPPPQ
jgi:hypothetical protein